MSLLFPLYLAGLGALAAPIIFHLIRRTPSGRTPFSTLMFLRKSPPRMVKRKSLDHLPLLCLRALILILLALAFARPFLRDENQVDGADLAGTQVAVLLDTSASVRVVWDEVTAAARASIDDAPSTAQVSLASFDHGWRWHVAPDAEPEPDGRRALVRASLDALEAGYGATGLARALVGAAEDLSAQLEDGAVATLVVVTDLQEGTAWSELEDVVWPDGVRLAVRRVAPRGGNVGLHPVPREQGGDDTLRVRLTSSADAERDRYTLRWHDGDGPADSSEHAVYCPAGETRVIVAPPRPPEADRLVLVGDGRPFDNVLYDRPPERAPLEVPFVGPRTEKSLGFYLGHAITGHPTRATRLLESASLPALDPLTNPVVVVEVGASNPSVAALSEHANQGGLVLCVLTAAEGAPFLAELLDDPGLSLDEGAVERGHALLGEIDFSHPLFLPFADPRFRNFTGIHFWRRRALTTSATVVAAFEDGAPFLVERGIGAGRVLVMTSGWTPADSDLARSTRFPGLVQALLRVGGDQGLPESYRVGQAGAETSAPGHYESEVDGRRHRYTVLVDPAESRTEPQDLDVLDRFEVPVTSAARAAATKERERQERVREMERRQSVWRWLVLAALAGLFVETLWAGRLARRSEES